MKILHINSSDNGGAATAAIRIHQSLLNQGIDSCFMSMDNRINDGLRYVKYNTKIETFNKPDIPVLSFKNYIIEKITKRFTKSTKAYVDNLKKQKERFELRFEQEKFEILSTPFSNYDLTKSKAYQEADIIHLHWVAGYLDFPSFFQKNNKPVVWTIHDENPFRGAFHYKRDEEFNALEFGGLDNFYKNIKIEALSTQKMLEVVAPSKWLCKSAVESVVFKNRRIHHIYYSLDTSVFKSWNKDFARDFFSLPKNIKIFMFVAQHIDNKRKGYDLLAPIIEKDLISDSHYLVVGKNINKKDKTNVTYTGTISDDRIMALAYSAADFFVLPSREDNLPNTMLESIACGTPVISFSIGDAKEVIEESGCGLLAEELSSDSLKDTMIYGVNNQDLFKRDRLVKFANENFNQSNVLRYESIYKDLLKN